MPTTKNALIRYKFLDRLLSDRHHYYDRTALWEKVNEMLYDAGFKEVTKRCIETDIIDLMD
ncbi:MAG: WYL domain-containing protein, partial [Bacteroidaceae bacterium]|nr:WYL domain-containing protein [Bacteroidaceae bacterium]